MPERLVVVGGDAAGMSAASQARRRRPADDLDIVVFERSSYVSYSACGEPYYVGGHIPSIDRLIARTPAEFKDMAIAVHLRHHVEAIEPQAGRVVVRDLDGNTSSTYGYDHLVYATGTAPLVLPLDGLGLRGVHVMHTLDDALAVRHLVETDGRRAVVVGGGYVGLEMVEAFVERGLETLLVTRGQTVLSRTLDPDMGQWVTDRIRSMGIEVHTGVEVSGLEGRDGRVTHVVSTDGRRFAADVVLLGLGTRPEVRLAQDAGIPLGASGAVWVDRRQQTQTAGIWAAGDCAEARHLVSGQPVNFHLGTIANKQGRVAGINLGGDYATFPGVLGTAITKICDLEIACTGLTEAAATAAAFAFETATVDSTTQAGYWPGAALMRLKVLAERESGRLLGAQIAGGNGAAKRIDVFAAALWNAMRVEDMVNMDLAYAPPFSSVWDPVLIAARRAWEAIR